MKSSIEEVGMMKDLVCDVIEQIEQVYEKPDRSTDFRLVFSSPIC